MKKLLAFLTLAFISTTCIYAQSPIKVKILNSASQRPAANVSFTITKEGTVVITKLTDANGIADIGDLADGSYEFFVAGTDLIGEERRGFVLPGKNKELVFYIQDKNIAILESVVVQSTKLELNRQDATVQSFISKKEILALPIEGRDITRSFYRLPNLTIATLGYNEAPNVAINGLSGLWTNYMIDGMDNNERFLSNVKFNTPFGFTESVNVLTNNYTAEYGNTSTGIINVNSRSGSNESTGEVFYLTRPGKIIDAKSAFATRDLYGNPVKDGFQRHQIGVGLGGAIKKDKTFYYINFERTFDIKDNLLNVPALGINEAIRGNNDFSYASAKIDQYWSKRFHSSLRANYGIIDLSQQGGGPTGGIAFPSTATTQKNRTYLIALKNDYTISGRLKGETNFQTSWFNWNYREPKNFGKPGVNVQGPTGAVIASLGPGDFIFDNDEYTQQFQQKFNFQAGKHALKAGMEFTTSDFSLLGGGNNFGFYTVRLTQSQLDSIKGLNLGSSFDVQNIPGNVGVQEYRVDLSSKDRFGTTQNVFNAYAEDNFAVNQNLNLGIGLRFDYDNLSKAGGTKGDWNNFGPRLSFNYKLDEDNVIRGGYARAYDKIKYSVTSDNLQFSNNSANFKLQLAELQRQGILDKNADLDRITFPGNLRATYLQGNTPSFLNGPTSEQAQFNRATQSSTTFRIKNPNGYQNPYSDQYTISYQRKIQDHLRFETVLLYSRTENLYQIVNLNAASSYIPNPANPVIRTRAAANLTRPVPISTNASGQFVANIGGTNYRGIARDVFMTQTTGKARYSAINLIMQKDKLTTDKYSYRLSYTLSKIKTDSEGINQRASNGNDYEPEYAFGDNDRRHIISGIITFYPVKNLTLTPSLLFQSGQPFSRFASAAAFGGNGDLDGNGETAYGNSGPSDYQPGETRNNDRLPSASTIDFSAKYTFKLNEKQGIELSADIYNLLNTENLSGFSSTRGTSNQNQFGPRSANNFTKFSAAPPRQFQFGLRYIW